MNNENDDLIDTNPKEGKIFLIIKRNFQLKYYKI